MMQNNSEREWFIGIDPGFKGAVVAYRPRDRAIHALRMPTLKITRGDKLKTEIDRGALCLWLAPWSGQVHTAAVERVGAAPGQGTSSMFAFGKGAGIVLMACTAHGFPVIEPPPVTWKKYMAVTADKDSSRARASALLPEHAVHWKNEGVAEAALIAVYAARTEGGFR